MTKERSNMKTQNALMCTVMNLATGDKQEYSCSPREAVIAAFAQSRGDWSTWRYEQRYGNQVELGELTYLLGNFSAFRGGTQF